MAPARILLADDNPGILEHAASLLGREHDVVGRLSDGESVLRDYDRLQPDVVVLDISMGSLNGIEVARRLRGQGRRAGIIFLTVHEDQDFVDAALGAGGAAYVVKSRMNTDLANAVRAVLNGELFVSAPLRG